MYFWKMQWWSFIRKFQMMSWHLFFLRKICKFSDFFWRLGLSEFHAMSEVSSWFCFDEHFWLNFFFFLVLANQSKGMSVWHQKKLLLFFGRISCKIYKSWIFCLTVIYLFYFVLGNGSEIFFFFTTRKNFWNKIFEIKFFQCKK